MPAVGGSNCMWGSSSDYGDSGGVQYAGESGRSGAAPAGTGYRCTANQCALAPAGASGNLSKSDCLEACGPARRDRFRCVNDVCIGAPFPDPIRHRAASHRHTSNTVPQQSPLTQLADPRAPARAQPRPPAPRRTVPAPPRAGRRSAIAVGRRVILKVSIGTCSKIYTVIVVIEHVPIEVSMLNGSIAHG
jgi:hypothetical protein